MSEKPYHINPETGKPNICRATEKRRCKYKNEDGTEPPHFPTREAAQAHQNEKDEKKYGPVATLSKKGSGKAGEAVTEEVAGDQSENPQLEKSEFGSKGDTASTMASKEGQSFSPTMGAGTKWRALLDEDPRTPTKEESEREAQEMFREFQAVTEDDYEMEEAIGEYAGTKYRYVNRLLRGGMEWDEADDIIGDGEGDDHEDPDELIEDVEGVVTAMDNAFKRNAELGFEKTRALYRVIEVPSYEPQEYIQRKFKVGESYQDAGYMSTSQDPSFVAGVVHKAKEDSGMDDPSIVVFEIVSKRGLSAQQSGATNLGFQAQDFERERILPRDLPLTIVGVQEKRFAVDEERGDMQRFYDYQGFGADASESHVPEQRVMVVQLVESDLLGDEAGE